jgi:hypothetical protein
MATRTERLDRLAIPSPCPESWQAMSGADGTRFCARCSKHVHDLAALEPREIEALIEATQGRFCGRMTRDRAGRLVTREPQVVLPPPEAPLPSRRPSPVAAAVLSAFVGLTGAAWASAPAAAPSAASPGTPDKAAPEPARTKARGVRLGGQVVDDRGASLPGTTITLRPVKDDWRWFAVTGADGRFAFEDVPAGTYEVAAELDGFVLPAETVTLRSKGRQITFVGTLDPEEVITITGEFAVAPQPLGSVYHQSALAVLATTGPSLAVGDPAGHSVQQVRTELRITSVLKGKPRGQVIQLDHYELINQSNGVAPGTPVLALLFPLGPGDGRPDSLVYRTADPLYFVRLLPADPRLPPAEAGGNDAGWRALAFLAEELHDDALRGLLTRATAELTAAREQLAADDRRFQQRAAALEQELWPQFLQALNEQP